MRHLLFTLLCIWSFSVLPSYSAWAGAGQVIALRGDAPADGGACCEPCEAGAGCCVEADASSPVPAEPCCPVPDNGDTPACPCSGKAPGAGILFAFSLMDAEFDEPDGSAVALRAWRARCPTRSLRIPVPPPRV